MSAYKDSFRLLFDEGPKEGIEKDFFEDLEKYTSSGEKVPMRNHFFDARKYFSTLIYYHTFELRDRQCDSEIVAKFTKSKSITNREVADKLIDDLHEAIKEDYGVYCSERIEYQRRCQVHLLSLLLKKFEVSGSCFFDIEKGVDSNSNFYTICCNDRCIMTVYTSMADLSKPKSEINK